MNPPISDRPISGKVEPGILSDHVWEIEDGDEYSAEISSVHGEVHVATVYGHGKDFPRAALIAAAPELLDALYTMLNLEAGIEVIPALKGKLDLRHAFNKAREVVRKADKS